MQYSLKLLNKNSKLKNITCTSLVDTLNLIGFEVDDIKIEKTKSNPFCEDINLLLKIPANREDLLTENFLLSELNTIFLFENYDTWKNISSTYKVLINNKYKESLSFETKNINSNHKNVLSFVFEIENFKNKATPNWIKQKLKINGLDSQNLLTDLIQLVNFEWGQSLNIFFNNDIKNNEFSFETLEKNTTFESLDNKLYNLFKDNLVLKNSKGEIVTFLGLNNTNINEILLENNTFFLNLTFYDIHENLLNLNTINTKISLRYLRKSFLQTINLSLKRFFTLLELTTDSKIIPRKYSLNNILNFEKPFRKVNLQKINLKRFLNVTDINKDIFKKAGLKLICETNKEFYFKISSIRKDLEREIDLIEEYSRFIGYKNFVQIKPQKELIFSKKIRKNLSIIKEFFLNHNFIEVSTNSLVEKTENEKIAIKLTNPLNSELNLLRIDLIQNLIEIFKSNLRGSDLPKNFFEVGRVFKKNNFSLLEEEKIAGIFSFYNNQRSNNFELNWFEAKGFIENFLLQFGYDNCIIKKIEFNNSNFHQKRTILFIKDNKILGVFGEINPFLKKELFLKKSTYIFQLNLHHFKNWRLNKVINIYKEFPKYPSTTKDLSFLLEKNIDLSEIKTVIKSTINYLKDVTFFDIYFDEQLAPLVNIAIRLEFQSRGETLITEDIELELSKIRSLLIQKFNVKFRD